MRTYTVLLDDDTVGQVQTDIEEEQLVGEMARVFLHDENGVDTYKAGTIKEVLSQDE